MPIPRIAASTYLNSFPLCYSFLDGSQRDRCEFVGDVSPARCAEMLSAGEVDAALIPSIEYQRIPDIVLVPQIAVGAREDVRSVVLVSHQPLAQARSIALDPTSRTSVVLLQILFSRFLRQPVEFITGSEDPVEMLGAADAALLIGDPALRRTCEPGNLRVYDLARLWRNYTGLPFSFALWGIRRSSLARCEQVDFIAARNEGLASLDRMIEGRARELRLSNAYVRAYLTECITYDLTPEHVRGLDLFFQLAHEIGSIDQITPIHYLEQVPR